MRHYLYLFIFLSSPETHGSRTVCDYVLQLDVLFYFTVLCNTHCRSMEVQRIVSVAKLNTDQMDLSWNFQMYLNQHPHSTREYYVKQLFICM